ncbi:MAG: hypothetical protein K2H60_03785 [Muribaculaceae bacterium]|nr:hypothetical protein [Muribaculaceae bacterium]
MSVTQDRRFTKAKVAEILDNAVGKTLGEVDAVGSRQFERTLKKPKITGIAGDVIEQSLFGYARDANQECDIEIDGTLVELKTTGVRVPKSEYLIAQKKTGDAYNLHLGAKEGISITAVTLEPSIQTEFTTSHFWEKAEKLLIVFYEYQSYEAVPASEYANFPIVGYCFNTFSESEQRQLRKDWEIIRDYLKDHYDKYPNFEERRDKLVGFTHNLRPNLLLVELVPAYKKKNATKPSSPDNFQKPRYRLKKTFVDYIVRGHFNKSRIQHEINLKESFSSFAELDSRCHELTVKYRGLSFPELKKVLGIASAITIKDFASKVILKMFDANCKRLNQITDFTKAGIEARTIILTPDGRNTEDMKFHLIDFDEWADRNTDFEDSEVFTFFMEHSLLCPIFTEYDSTDKTKTVFEGFKRFSFDDDFIDKEVRRMWDDSRKLIHTNNLVWEYEYDRNGKPIKNKSGSYKGAPNFPKKAEYTVFFRGGANDSSDESRTQIVNDIRMLPQSFWLKGRFISEKLKSIPYL